jgi:hypothetical protein
MLEASLVKKIKAAILARWPDAWVRKLADTHTRGLPDLLIIVLGHAIMAEIKTEAGRLKPIQKAEHDKIRRAGGTVVVSRGVEEIIAFIEEVVK